MPTSPQPQSTRTKFISPGELIEGTINSVLFNTDPFHCTVKITPVDPDLIPAEGRYSDNELSLGKLRRNLSHLKFKIKDLADVLSAVESLEGRKCIFKIDPSGWVAWIDKLIIEAIPAPTEAKETESIEERLEIYFIRVPGSKSIYTMQTVKEVVRGFAVGPTGRNTSTPHGWVLDLNTLEEAKEVLKKRKQL